MERFHRIDPGTGQPVEVWLHEPVTHGDRLDHYQVVELRFADGRHYRTSLWRDPQERGRHWWDEPGMVIVHDLTLGLVFAAVDDILRQGAVEAACEPVGGPGQDAGAGAAPEPPGR